MDEPATRRRRWGSLSVGALLVGAVATAFGCGRDGDEKTALAAEPAPPSAPAPAATTQAGPAKAKFREAGFDLEMRSAGEYRVGEDARVEVVLAAKSPYKCNDKYPYKLKLDETPGVEFPADVVKKDKATVEAKKVVMTVPFKPTAKGEKKIAGRFSFSICTEDKCLIEKRDLALAVSVN